MFQYMTAGTIAFLLASGFFIAVLIAAFVIGYRRRRDPNFTPPPVRFVPHWQMMLMVGFALLAILAAILIPLIARLMGR